MHGVVYLGSYGCNGPTHTDRERERKGVDKRGGEGGEGRREQTRGNGGVVKRTGERRGVERKRRGEKREWEGRGKGEERERRG